jgi:hypothetical protein
MRVEALCEARGVVMRIVRALSTVAVPARIDSVSVTNVVLVVCRAPFYPPVSGFPRSLI